MAMRTDPIERVAAANPVAARLTAEEQREADALLRELLATPVERTPRRRRVRRLAVAAAAACGLLAALALLDPSDSGSPAPGIVERAVAAVSDPDAVYHAVTRTRVTSSGRRIDSAHGEEWRASDGSVHLKVYDVADGRRGRLRGEFAGTLRPRGGGRFGGPALIYDPRARVIRRTRFGQVRTRLPVAGPTADPGAALRELQRHGRLRVEGSARVGGRRAFRLVSDTVPGPAGGDSVERVVYLVDARSYHPLATRYVSRAGGDSIEVIIRYLVFERLPLDARGRRLLELDPHPGVPVVDRMGRRVPD